MSERQDAHADSYRERKRAEFTARPSRNGKPVWILVALALIASGGYFGFSGVASKPLAAEIAAAAPSEDAIVIPVSDLTEGKARFFDYIAKDRTRMRFFIVKDSGGIYRVALDACDVCYKARKGYSQRGADMVCKQCGQSFPISRVNEESGGCNPTPLERQVVGGNLVIPKSELESRSSYF